MSTITVRLNKDEAKAFEDFAKLNNIPLSTLLKKALEEKMETELDMQAIKTYESESSHETYAHEDLKKLLGL